MAAAVAALPFKPTAAQERAVREVLADMQAGKVMYRWAVGGTPVQMGTAARIPPLCSDSSGLALLRAFPALPCPTLAWPAAPRHKHISTHAMHAHAHTHYTTLDITTPPSAP